MAENRRYYWLKLKEDFFTDKKNIRRRYLYNYLSKTLVVKPKRRWKAIL